MKIRTESISVRKILEGYNPKNDQNWNEDVWAMNGQLNIRPKYQRNFQYENDRKRKVMDTLIKGYPLNSMYWVKNVDGKFEVLDGQQRILSILSFITKQDFDYNEHLYDWYVENGLEDKILDKKIHVYIIEESEDYEERLKWFKTINIAGKILTEQELRNIEYTGKWLTDAKKNFSCEGTVIVQKAEWLTRANFRDQGLLEIALKWICDFKDLSKISEYMILNQSSKDASELVTHFENISDFVQELFGFKHKQIMRGADWGIIYKKYKENIDVKDISLIDSVRYEVDQLVKNEEIEKKSGIFQFVLAQKFEPEYSNRKLITSRIFSKDDAYEIYEKNNRKCALLTCSKPNKVWEFNEMEADHKVPWTKGGETKKFNLQMLCIKCNREKSSK